MTILFVSCILIINYVIKLSFSLKKDDLIPEFVRMIFHDCVGPEGCNGCLDVHTHANGGKVVEGLSSFYHCIMACCDEAIGLVTRFFTSCDL